MTSAPASDEANWLQCYNKGCGCKFDPTTNSEKSCKHHPGLPVFHDAYKGWGCCNKKVTDFTEFLNIPGCTNDFHSNIKPVEPGKQQTDAGDKDEVIVSECPKPLTRLQPPPEDEPMQRLPVTVAATLKSALSRDLEELSIAKEGGGDKENVDTAKVVVGTSCKNNTCHATYSGMYSSTRYVCLHPGVPIFHEGMKYWSCCQRKTSDFDNFLKQEGCDLGSHVWVKKQGASTQTAVACRYDWHQTAHIVVLTIYSKVADPESSYVEANRTCATVHVTFDRGGSVFEKSMRLGGIIDNTSSTVTMTATKVEVKLRKAEPFPWQYLDLPRVADSGAN
ncbi:PREDICTED: LOW QUALITY PROTEIN: cysteine and histidine-rich domain-containing protein 1-like [Priapulus caudatus]|uniref:LOW QUALITY PROTEIN: cysteine and histidine-rich domain-containing protein 1-like n=1 Tax=Priapulus caudatus TaxID=37621 RepID=A0ABM1ER04_PRICU|nr:PREDICTED: LOW QUALITY PROTEIN: cysteine and histidine-rich domain-containing protein 1-like [Priapulus caudatus]